MKVGKTAIHYIIGGQGEPLVVTHGGAGGADAWTENLVELAKNYMVYVPDMLGFGRSQAMEGDYYIMELVDFVDRFAHKLGLSKFHLLGHSLGGSVVLGYVIKSPHKITKLVLVSSMCLGREIALWVRFLSSPDWSRSFGAAALAVLKGVKWVVGQLFSGIEFVLPFFRTSMIVGCSITTLKEQAIVLINQLSEVLVPTLVVWGARDTIVPVKHVYAAGQLTPACRVKVFAGCGHYVHRQKIPEFSRLLNDFLE